MFRSEKEITMPHPLDASQTFEQNPDAAAIPVYSSSTAGRRDRETLRRGKRSC
jgi:hypothetical protein